VIAKGRGEQPQPVAALAINLVSLLEDRDAGPLQIAGIDREILLVVEHLEPVVEAAAP
jgi:hypothetical protein